MSSLISGSSPQTLQLGLLFLNLIFRKIVSKASKINNRPANTGWPSKILIASKACRTPIVPGTKVNNRIFIGTNQQKFT